jgi:type 1 glutamine amidotransferase
MLAGVNSYPSMFLLGLMGLGAMINLRAAAPLRVLYFTKSAGYEHSVVKWVNNQPGSSYSERVLTTLAGEHNFVFTFSKDAALFSPEYLAQFDVVMFYTSGDLFSVGEDGAPGMTAAGKQALFDAIAGGKGFVGLHSASDSFHTFEHGAGNPSDRHHRYELHGDDSDPYVKFLGGEFINHDVQQVANARVADPAFPGMQGLGGTLSVMEEWYSLKEFAPNLHATLVMDTKGMEGVDYQRPSYPLAWARSYGKGRVYYNAMGHREDIWDNPKFQEMVIGAIAWAGGRKKADVTPNLKEVAPDANTLPPMRPGT